MPDPNSKINIFTKAMKIKADVFLNPPAIFWGINGIKKLSKEMVNWEEELGKQTKKMMLYLCVQEIK